MNRLLPEDLAVFKKDYPEAVRFLLEAHKRFRENAKIMRKAIANRQSQAVRNIFTVVKRKE